ncbi:hypothetical protein [Limnoglobus roseus]|uniref:DUF4058 domain-containing protein n=1 Tax=Limnoglobus roseus TaxID=2598579 RepID=A0A5C1AG65_9BACT|nr:hypothetical protein [Limnoglobus roseus]QEL16104.1 hypothetical protein PX52LOC_03043 [Limnoglobus roseus]
MPLLDHFHPPLSRTHPWRSFHGTWAAAIARLLNAGVLPDGYYAAPFLDRDGPSEIDVAALQDGTPSAPQAWAVTEPALTVAVEWMGTDDVRVEVFTDDGDPRLAAAIELVSPRNKDRPQARDAFTAKCVDRLRHGCGLVVVDVVTTRRADLHVELLTALAIEAGPVGGSLSAVGYRPVRRDADGRLLAWPSALEIGRPLPTVPLWLLGMDVPVPLDLEASHTTACADLRIRPAG